VVLFMGAVSSTAYSLGYFGKEPFAFFGGLFMALITEGIPGVQDRLGFLEVSPTAWRPPLWPIKIVLCVGVFLMILQALAEFFRDIEYLREGDADVA
jgi:TRAP-type mannitol/chloroaromatic compound transport system permease small subunit